MMPSVHSWVMGSEPPYSWDMVMDLGLQQKVLTFSYRGSLHSLVRALRERGRRVGEGKRGEKSTQKTHAPVREQKRWGAKKMGEGRRTFAVCGSRSTCPLRWARRA